ncbi:GH92 family glycosyl hydrolase [Aureitalea marina]|uniref:Glycosyl hydrolase family 92 n=1 Tax=Aureitalea marina TaxID=930804 RepID=A0A2S7KRE9_9FLAO|nr:GH92 family glycosyl hydrolase [Aureitalea marina]PQB05177.1 glycosyl hydrolase family 92 [Aureitalea marina]
MSITYRFLVLSFLLISCKKEQDTAVTEPISDPTTYVDPFIGTGGHGHTYPGATMPFGMIQISPDTRLEGWDGCSGYHYSDQYIYGFSHTHLSGTGVSDYGDILLMPTDSLIFHNGADGRPGYRWGFSHENEDASPGYYHVLLDSTGIEVELTVTERAGIHRYNYPSSENQHLILDLEHRDQLIDFDIKTISDREISGFRRSKAWAEDQHLYFYIRFSHPFESPTFFHRDPDRRDRMGGFTFVNPDNDPVTVRIGISAVDVTGAQKNLEAEIGDKSFEQVHYEATEVWNRQLNKIKVGSSNRDHLTNFYTALYHTMIAPNLYQDVDGRYRGMDLEIHQTEDFNYYTVFSLWDTYRAAHPLYTIIEQERTVDFINTFLAKYEEGGIMPIWDLAGNYTGCMIGYHAVPVIVDAYLKGIEGFDAELAFEAMKHSAMQDKLGLEAFKELNYIPVERESESVSKTLEYAYDDWTIAQMAEALGKKEDASYFNHRALAYRNLFDPKSKFLRGRINNRWFSPFDPYEVNFNYTEANAWQYSTYAPHDISGLIALHGGKAGLEDHLDKLFTAQSQTSGRDQADITGLIGQYAHGNEPSHHMAYLYNYLNKPSKTQEKVKQILTELYTPTPDGISGNEDCGQMSAWYVLSSMGFYPVTPGSNQYIIGSPLFEQAEIQLENGNIFQIIAPKASDLTYIKNVSLNGTELNRTYITHQEIMAGGELTFQLSEEPTNWGTKSEQTPLAEVDDAQFVALPFISSGQLAFQEMTQIELKSIQEDARIFYRLDDQDVFEIYDGPIAVKEEAWLSTYASLGDLESPRSRTRLRKIDPNLKITLETEYANQYNGGGQQALINGQTGGQDFRTGAWQGYQDTDLIAVIDLGEVKDISSVRIGFLQDQRSWIFYPTKVDISLSDSTSFLEPDQTVEIAAEVPSDQSEIKRIQFDIPTKKARYLKVHARNFGDLPDWHLGAAHNGKAWLFVDEIGINQQP